MPIPLIIHHAGCADGFASACLVLAKHDGNAETIPLSYNDPLPPLDRVAGRTVYFVDFSIPDPAVLLEYAAASGDLYWYDHHVASLGVAEAVAGKPGVTAAVFDIEESGASLTQRELGIRPRGLGVYDVISYVRDRDLWLWKLPQSRAISAAIEARFGAYYNEPAALLSGEAVWAAFLKLWPSELARDGEILLQSQHARMKRIAADARTIRFEETYFRVVNATSDASELADYFSDNTSGPCDCIITYRQLKDGRWSHSVRERRGSGFDCNAFAKQYGGGGHKAAAGFVIDTIVTDPSFPWRLP